MGIGWKRVGMFVWVWGCQPEAEPLDSGVDPDPENCEQSARVEMRMSFLDYFNGQAIEGLEVRICDTIEITDDSGFVNLLLPVDSLTKVDIEGHDQYPPTRFVLRSPDLAGWDWVEQQAGGTLWLPRKMMSMTSRIQLHLALGVEEDTSKGSVEFQISPYGLGFELSGTSYGATPSINGLDYEMVAGQVGVAEFEERANLGMQEGSVYFHNVSPGTAKVSLENATNEPCAYMPAMEQLREWIVDVEAGVHLVLPFQCKNPE